MTPAARSTSAKEEEHMGAEDATPTTAKDAPYYCPGCGKRGNYPQQCTGRPEAPHPPIEMVETGEIGSDNETPAPNTENLG